MTALMIFAGLSTFATLLIVTGLLMSRRCAGVTFEAGEIALSTSYDHAAEATSGRMTPAFSY